MPSIFVFCGRFATLTSNLDDSARVGAVSLSFDENSIAEIESSRSYFAVHDDSGTHRDSQHSQTRLRLSGVVSSETESK